MENSMFKILDSAPRTRQVIAAMINGKISGSIEHMAQAAHLISSGKAEEYNISIQFITRAVVDMMAACDFGYNWEQLAKSPTYFAYDENGVPCAIKGGIWKIKAEYLK